MEGLSTARIPAYAPRKMARTSAGSHSLRQLEPRCFREHKDWLKNSRGLRSRSSAGKLTAHLLRSASRLQRLEPKLARPKDIARAKLSKRRGPAGRLRLY